MFYKKAKYLAAALAAMICLSSCNIKSGETLSQAGSDNQNLSILGRFVQYDITPKIEEGFETVFFKEADNKLILSLYNTEANEAQALIYTDGAWQEQEAVPANKFLQDNGNDSGKSCAYYDGNEAWWAYKFDENHVLQIYKIMSDQIYSVPVEDVTLLQNLSPQSYVSSFQAGENTITFCIATENNEMILLTVTREDAKICSVITPDAADYKLLVEGEKIYLRNIGARRMDVYDLITGKKIEDYSLPDDLLTSNAYSMDSNGETVYLTTDGIFKYSPNSAITQTIVQERGFVYALPKTKNYFLATLDDFDYAVACTRNGETTVFQINLQEDISSDLPNQLYLWALEDYDLIRGATAVFASENPDCDVILEFGKDNTETNIQTEDIIRALNTRLLAKEAPDVLFLDGLPVNDLIDKGLLAPLNCIVDEEFFYENVINTYQKDGEIYAYPSLFQLPIFVNCSDNVDVNSINDLSDVAEIYKDKQLIYNVTFKDIFDSFYGAMSCKIFPNEQAVDEYLLLDFYEQTKSMIDSMGITLETNPYFMQTGDGQSTVNKDYAMSLYKVAEGITQCGTGVLESRIDALKLFWKFPKVEIIPLPGNSFIPKYICSIPASAANPTLAKKFISTMLTDGSVQLNTLNGGFSVKRGIESEFVAQLVKNGEQVYASDPLQFNWDGVIQKLENHSLSSETIRKAVYEQACALYQGDIDAQQAVTRTVSQLKLYFAEQE